MVDLAQINQHGAIYEKFLNKITIAKDGCWIFGGKKGAMKCFSFPKVSGPIRHHRFSFELYKGPIPEGMHIDHLCMEKACCNPDHLEAVTAKENVARYYKAKRTGETILGNSIPSYKSLTHCRNGHEFSNLGFYYYKNIKDCRACRREADKRRRDRTKR